MLTNKKLSQNTNIFIAKKLKPSKKKMLTNMKHKIKNTPRFLSHAKHTNLQWYKKQILNINTKKLKQEVKTKNKPTKLSKKIITTKITQLFLSSLVTNEKLTSWIWILKTYLHRWTLLQQRNTLHNWCCRWSV
jgi:hypothetical protein